VTSAPKDADDYRGGVTSDQNPGDVDRSVDEVARHLRAYVEVSRGVRSEFSPEQADLDPRVEDAARELGFALGRFEDAFEGELGFVPEVGAAWVSEPLADEPEQPPTELLVDEFRIGMVVGVADGTSPDALDAVLPIIDDATSSLVDRLWDHGFNVTEFFVSRGEDSSLDDLGVDAGDDGEDEP
jgi:hypothetical protein